MLPGLKQSEFGAADSVAVSSRKNIPAGYPGVLLAREIAPAFGITSGQLTNTSDRTSACWREPATRRRTSYTALPPAVNFTCVPCVESKTKPAAGAEDGTLQVNAYCPPKRAGHFVGSSSSVKKVRPVAWMAVRT